MAESLREELSDYAHDTWSRWVGNLFADKGKLNADGTFTIDKEVVQRWMVLAELSYDQLSEEEKDKDREQADMMLEIMERH